MNRAQHRAQVSYARELARLPWQPLAIKRLTPEDRSRFERIGCFVDGWVNNVVAVQTYNRDTAWGRVLHLAVRRHDETEIVGWDLLQRVKNEVVGEDRVALEVYPRATELLDLAPMRHLFVLPEGFEMPLTINGRWA